MTLGHNDTRMAIGMLLANHWWMTAIRGVIAILLGLALMIWPEAALVIFLTLFGIFTLLGGISLVITALRGRTVEGYWLLLLEGLLGIGIGLLALLRPVTTGVFLLLVVAVWAITTGFFQIGVAIRLRREIKNEWLLAVAGIVSILFGLLFVIWPIAGVTAILWVVGAYAISLGLLLIVLAFRLKNWRKRSYQIHAERSLHQDL